MGNVVDVAESVSKKVWEWLKVSSTLPHGSAAEPGITSYLMTELSRSTDYAKLFTFRSTKKESTSGSDFCIAFLSGPRKGITYLVQAKKMYKKSPKRDIGKNLYQEFHRKVGGSDEYQFFTLINYALVSGFTPLYVFYNSIYDQRFGRLNCSSLDDKFSPTNLDVLGVTLTNANEIYDNDHFKSGGVPYAMSFEEHVGYNSSCTLQQFFRNTLSSYWGKDPIRPTNPTHLELEFIPSLELLGYIKKMLTGMRTYKSDKFEERGIRVKGRLILGQLEFLKEDVIGFTSQDANKFNYIHQNYERSEIDKIVDLVIQVLKSSYEEKNKVNSLKSRATFTRKERGIIQELLQTSNYDFIMEQERNRYLEDHSDFTWPRTEDLSRESLEAYKRLTAEQQEILRATISKNYERLPILAIFGEWDKKSGGMGNTSHQ